MIPTALQRLSRDGWLLFATRFLRLFAYGSLSVVLVFYLIGVGLSEPQTGMLLTLTLAGDTAISLVLTTRADRFARRGACVVHARRILCDRTRCACRRHGHARRTRDLEPAGGRISGGRRPVC